MQHESHSPCRCRNPPFFFGDFETLVIGEDSTGAEVSIDRCRACGTDWLNYQIEEPHYTRSGRWWRVSIPEASRSNVHAQNARAFVEEQATGFVGGCYFSSSGHEVTAPIRVF